MTAVNHRYGSGSVRGTRQVDVAKSASLRFAGAAGKAYDDMTRGAISAAEYGRRYEGLAHAANSGKQASAAPGKIRPVLPSRKRIYDAQRAGYGRVGKRIGVPKRIKLEPMIHLEKPPGAVAQGLTDALSGGKMRSLEEYAAISRRKRLARVKEGGHVKVVRKSLEEMAGVSKIGDWKTIDQRDESRRKARRQKVKGGAAIYAGAVIGGAAASDPRAVPQARRIMQAGRKGGGWTFAGSGEPTLANGPQLIRRVRRVGRMAVHYPTGGTLLGGAALASAGAVGYAQARTREGYHQRKINERRRANRKRATVGKAFRYKHPEAERQRRLGTVIGAGAVGGGLLAFKGGRGVVGNARTLAAATKPAAKSKAASKLKAIASQPAVLVDPKTAGQLVAAGSLLETSRRTRNYSRDSRNREWF